MMRLSVITKYLRPSGHETIVRAAKVGRSIQMRKRRDVVDHDIWPEYRMRFFSGRKRYVDAAFRSTNMNEAYLFTNMRYMLVDYTSGRLLEGPSFVGDRFPFLLSPICSVGGISCAFGLLDPNQAFIFSREHCVRINYGPSASRRHGNIIGRRYYIDDRFPFLKRFDFDSWLDAAFDSPASYEAYIFKEDQFVVIDYKEPRLVYGPRKITEGFHCLRGTIFETGIQAAFTCHNTSSYNGDDDDGCRSIQAYLFKDDQFACISFTPIPGGGLSDDHIVGGEIKKFNPDWPALASVLPVHNLGWSGIVDGVLWKDGDESEILGIIR